MLAPAATALSGMNAARTALDVAAHNVANAMTPGFRRQQVVADARPEGGVSTAVVTAAQPGSDLVQDTVDRLSAGHAFAANLAVFRTGDAMLGALLDASA